jgi:hypothetical protein
VSDEHTMIHVNTIRLFIVVRGQHYEHFLKKIIRNTQPVDWTSIDLTYLLKVNERHASRTIDNRFPTVDSHLGSL